MEIWVHRNGEYAGRFTESVIRGKIADGSLSENDLAWDQEKALWKPLREFLASLAAAKVEPVSSTPSDAVKEVPPASSAAPVEAKPAEVRRSGPPPLPSMPVAEAAPAPVRAVVPPALPTVFPATPTATAAAHEVPEGEKIWNPYVAILGSIFLSPAFGGFIIWRNWLRMNRRRRAMVAAPWFWIGFVVIGLLFYSRDRLVWVIWAAYLVAWIAFSAYPQIRYVHTTFKRERLMSGLPLLAALFLTLFGGVAYWLSKPDTSTIPTLAPGPTVQQPPVVAPVVSQTTDHVYSADELRDMYKSSVLEVRATWKEKKALNIKKDNGANGTGVLIYNDAEYGLVATNWHVVDPGENMTGDYKCGVRFAHDKDFADVEVVARAKNEVDLALLLVRLEGKWTPNQFPVRFLDHIKEGECCIAIGNALGEGLSITSGIVSRFDKIKDQTLIRTSTPVSPGNSGGPLILCRGGSLGGIVTLQSRITNVQNVNFATPAQYIFDKDIWEFESGQDKAQQLLDTAIRQAPKK
ncbi:MAG TPA: trypsin-like peptidase domain-containing protein [Chthoniobacterales bacterium]|nr:trypsin-like peptidase domain-containing protein [Chthoniobacterales bacterium]